MGSHQTPSENRHAHALRVGAWLGPRCLKYPTTEPRLLGKATANRLRRMGIVLVGVPRITGRGRVGVMIDATSLPEPPRTPTDRRGVGLLDADLHVGGKRPPGSVCERGVQGREHVPGDDCMRAWRPP